MAPTLEKRVEALERKFTEFAQQIDSGKKDRWRKTFGFSRRDDGFDDLLRRGHEYRQGLRKKNGRVDS